MSAISQCAETRRTLAMFFGIMGILLLGAQAGPVSAQSVLTFAPAAPVVQSCLGVGAGGFAPTQPFGGWIYQNLPAFQLRAGDVLAFDLGLMNDADVETDIEMAPTTANGSAIEGAPFTRIVSNTQTPLAPRGDEIVGNFEMQFMIEQSFDFPGGGLIIRFSNPSPAYARDDTCTESQVGVTATVDDVSGYFVTSFFGDQDGVAPWDNEADQAINGFQVTIFSDIELTAQILNDAGEPVDFAQVGDLLTYRLEARNFSAAMATGIEVTATLAPGLEYLGTIADMSQPSAAAVFEPGPPATVTWSVGALAPGATATLGIGTRVTLDASTQILSNSAQVTAVDAPLTGSPLVSSAVTVGDTTGDLLSGGSGNCFIATAAWGSFLAPEVRTLRLFRDRYLLTHEPGRRFVAWYYETSPSWAAWLRAHDGARLVVRVLLTPVVYAVKHPLAALLLVIMAVTWIARSGRFGAAEGAR